MQLKNTQNLNPKPLNLVGRVHLYLQQNISSSSLNFQDHIWNCKEGCIIDFVCIPMQAPQNLLYILILEPLNPNVTYWIPIGLEIRLYKHIHIHRSMLGVRWSHVLLALPFIAFLLYIGSYKYSLRFKIKGTFGHKLRYEMKVTFGEISLKLCQTNWNVARIDVNVVTDKLPSQITIYTCLIIDIWTQQRRHTSTSFLRFSAIRPKWRASNQIGARSFRLYYGHPYNSMFGWCPAIHFHNLKPTEL